MTDKAIDLKILSPRVVKFKTKYVITSHTSEFEYSDPVFNVPMTKSITTLTFGEFGSNPATIEFGMTSGKDERVKLFAGMQALIKSCVDNAEDIKDRIHNICITESRPTSEEERQDLMKMTFMKLKKWFINQIIKNKIYKEFIVFNSTKKLSIFSDAFEKFVVDRNKYTHGQLCFLSPSYEFILEYIETPEHQKKYAYLETEF